MSAFGIISDKSGDFRKLCSKLGVEKLELFGSGAREEFDPAKSDLDFIVSFFRDHRMGLADIWNWQRGWNHFSQGKSIY